MNTDDYVWRCTGCGIDHEFDDLQGIQPDGHLACPNHEDDDPALHMIWKGRERAANVATWLAAGEPADPPEPERRCSDFCDGTPPTDCSHRGALDGRCYLAAAAPPATPAERRAAIEAAMDDGTDDAAFAEALDDFLPPVASESLTPLSDAYDTLNTLTPEPPSGTRTTPEAP